MALELYRPGDSVVHRLPPQIKLVAALATVAAIVCTPTRQWWAFLAYLGVLFVVRSLARLPLRVVLPRLLIETPFLVFAVLIPFIAEGPRVDVGPVAVSSDGLWSAFGILAKGTLGVGASVLLTATTTIPDLLRGMERLRVPAVITGIMAFMVRYLEVLVSEMQRMRIARVARGADPRWLWQVGPIARGAGTLFVRSYERGERVHLAMRCRGFDGTTVALDRALGTPPAGRSQWAMGMAVPSLAALVAAAAWLGL